MAETQTPMTRQERLGALFEEYKALYSLATLRIGSLDRRSSVTIAVLGTFVASFAQVGADGQVVLLLGGPLALIWLVRSTTIHAQSFEDAIRRIDEIERTVNTLAGEQLLCFQSRHPSRGSAVGGRTGADTVYATVFMSLLVLAASGFLLWREVTQTPAAVFPYVCYLLSAGSYLIHCGVSYRRYRYRKQGLGGPAPPRPTRRGRRRP